jgi:hypothetical protein
VVITEIQQLNQYRARLISGCNFSVMPQAPILGGFFIGGSMEERICHQCGKSFLTKSSWIRKGGGKYCSVPCHNESQSGSGKSFHDFGYVLVKKPEHPRANLFGFVYEHLLVLEEKLGRPLLPGEEGHHKNRIPNDNRPENLEHFKNKSEHMKHHSRERLVSNGINPDTERKCPSCERILSKERFSPSSSRGRKTLSSHCKECRAEEQRKRRINHDR